MLLRVVAEGITNAAEGRASARPSEKRRVHFSLTHCISRAVASDHGYRMVRAKLIFLQCLTQIPVRALEPRSRGIATAPGQLRDKADRSLAQFFVGRLKIDHQISMHPPKPSHCACADDIQRDFCRRPCFQARGAGNDFWAGQKIDHKVPIFSGGSRAGC